MSEYYKKLVLDPRCLKPSYEINDRFVYRDALDAIDGALKHPYITQSEKNILENVKAEVTKNRFAMR